ncbi:unnamed protein product [Amoebophrya sp. A120]|nr:unnamed protein product [Amoebophrya sp. A120]|eukprot:GSA120T00003228001.1
MRTGESSGFHNPAQVNCGWQIGPDATFSFKSNVLLTDAEKCRAWVGFVKSVADTASATNPTSADLFCPRVDGAGKGFETRRRCYSLAWFDKDFNGNANLGGAGMVKHSTCAGTWGSKLSLSQKITPLSSNLSELAARDAEEPLVDKDGTNLLTDFKSEAGGFRMQLPKAALSIPPSSGDEQASFSCGRETEDRDARLWLRDEFWGGKASSSDSNSNDNLHNDAVSGVRLQIEVSADCPEEVWFSDFEVRDGTVCPAAERARNLDASAPWIPAGKSARLLYMEIAAKVNSADEGTTQADYVVLRGNRAAREDFVDRDRKGFLEEEITDANGFMLLGHPWEPCPSPEDPLFDDPARRRTLLVTSPANPRGLWGLGEDSIFEFRSDLLTKDEKCKAWIGWVAYDESWMTDITDLATCTPMTRPYSTSAGWTYKGREVTNPCIALPWLDRRAGNEVRFNYCELVPGGFEGEGMRFDSWTLPPDADKVLAAAEFDKFTNWKGGLLTALPIRGGVRCEDAQAMKWIQGASGLWGRPSSTIRGASTASRDPMVALRIELSSDCPDDITFSDFRMQDSSTTMHGGQISTDQSFAQKNADSSGANAAAAAAAAKKSPRRPSGVGGIVFV